MASIDLTLYWTYPESRQSTTGGEEGPEASIAQHEPPDYNTWQVIVVKIKRFASTLLLFVLVVMVPLETLSQLAPEVTYDKWCTHLAELHAEREAQISYLNLYFLGGFWGALGTFALGAGGWFLDQASFEDYLARLTHDNSKADEYRDAGAGLLAVGCAIWVLYLTYAVPRIREIKALYGERTIADVQREIELWEQAGAARMWFYPCE